MLDIDAYSAGMLPLLVSESDKLVRA